MSTKTRCSLKSCVTDSSHLELVRSPDSAGSGSNLCITDVPQVGGVTPRVYGLRGGIGGEGGFSERNPSWLRASLYRVASWKKSTRAITGSWARERQNVSHRRTWVGLDKSASADWPLFVSLTRKRNDRAERPESFRMKHCICICLFVIGLTPAHRKSVRYNL